MKFSPIEPPRRFIVGRDSDITIEHGANLALRPDEQVTFTTPAGGEYDVVRKSWGFYATPSLNGRLRRYGFRSALVRNSLGQLYLMLVEKDKTAEFETYAAREKQTVLVWLDDDEQVARTFYTDE